MTIRKKLVLSNILMILIPVLFCVVFGIVLLETWGNRYLNSLEGMFEKNGGVYTIQSTIGAYENELFTGDTDSVQKLFYEIAKQGYHLSVVRNDKELENTITKADRAFLEKYADFNSMKNDRVAGGSVSCSAGSAVWQKDWSGGNTVVVTAVAVGKANSDSAESYLKRFIYPFAAAFLLFALAAVIVTDIVLSRWIGKSIMTPLSALKKGTGEIADGNLDVSVDYHKKDEFGEVCAEFNKMRGKLKESVETQLQYEKYRTELVNGISHDLRTPLTSIKGYTEGLIDGIANTDEKRARYYAAILTRANDMEALVESLTVFSRLERGTYRYQLEPADMDAFIRNEISAYREEAEQKHVEVVYECALKEAPVRIDAQEMRRVFRNLFENSVKYRIKESSRIRIALDRNQDPESGKNDLRVRFTDDGPGVPEGELENIFNSFYRVDESRTNPRQGSGLGLAIVRQIIEGHQGSVRAHNSHPGLTIEILLPMADGGQNSASDTDEFREQY